MNSKVRLAFAASSVVVIVACSQDRAAVSPTEAAFDRIATAPVCSFTELNKDAKGYFADTRDPVFAAIDAMQAAYKTGAAAAREPGFAVLTMLGAAADDRDVNVTPLVPLRAKGTPALGSEVANDVLLCMGTIAGYAPTAAVPSIDFSKALGADGVFAVRNSNGNAPVASRASNVDGPLYGAQPESGNWKTGVGSALFYGYVIPGTDITNESTAGIGFELSSLPTGLVSSTNKLLAGVCTVNQQGARLLHQYATSDVILAPNQTLSFCTTQTGALPKETGFFASAQRAASWLLLPKPLHAMRLAGGVTGLLSGLSPSVPVTFAPAIAFSQQPTNSSLSASPQFTPAITVLVATTNGTPLQDVLVTLTVAGNSGSFIATNTTATTDANGIATFTNFNLNKAGGYTISATALGVTTLSSLFQVNGQ